ncbi:MAG: hypothetical protein KGQ51_07945 [Planctomycetes bacterium]|nr:hypothetical protein [Planctomycetota bacterium]
MARMVRRRSKQRIYWVEIGFLILGLIALRPSLVSDILNMGRNPQPYIPRTQLVGDYSNDYYRNYPSSAGVSSYYPVWNQPSYSVSDPRVSYDPRTTYDPRSSNVASSNVAWPDAQVHQYIHNGSSAPLVASPTFGNNQWNNNAWNSNSLAPYSGPNRYPSSTPVYTGRY